MNETPLASARLHTPLGGMTAVYAPQGLCLLAFDDDRHSHTALAAWQHRLLDGRGDARFAVLQQALDAYFAGQRRHFRDIATAPAGTPFQRAAWRALCDIPYGHTRSYAEQARALDKPRAVRAVAAANSRNPVSLLIPCHRVIGSNGKLTGYAGGLWRKQALLALERGASLSKF
ncbi:methylated-DNA--[protein]-cysteine S-methyltransferase, partial [Conchiformibius kuhniae]|uniref:Methylated-DNA--protein-cysteine methyltransferase n=1 Tax=Conchiformibius kuhniae TaxID=211502 RepID=A0A8T9MSS5_9NEIS